MILSKNEKYCNENTKGYDPVCDESEQVSLLNDEYMKNILKNKLEQL